ncbi:TraR/DksA C4-type zinc finger protein [Thermopirellula anaerolimosa]
MPIRYYKLSCGSCGKSETISRHEAMVRLAAARKLRATAWNSDEGLLDELIPALLAAMPCSCGEKNRRITGLESADDWTESRRCRDCGRVIPPARLAVLPDAEKCADCQTASEQGRSTGPDRYCPRCGHPMKLTPRDVGGVTRYVWVCTKIPPCRGV